MLLDAALRGAAVALLLILAAAFARGDRASTTVRIGIVFAIGLVVQLVSSAPTFEASVPRLWQAPFVGVSVGNAVLFWLFAQALFDDDFVPKAWHGIVWLAIVAVSARNCAVGWHADSLAGTVAIDAQRAAPLVFAALAVFASASTWRADLVERRRRLRVFIVAIGSCYTVGLLALRFASPDGRLDTASATVDAAALTFLVGVAAAAMLRPASSDLIAPLSPSRVDETTPTPVGPARPEPEPRPDPADARLAEALERVMRDEHAYRQEGMTLPALASAARRARVPPAARDQPASRPSQLQRVHQRVPARRGARRAGRPRATDAAGADDRVDRRLPVDRPVQPRVQDRHRRHADGVQATTSRRFVKAAGRIP